MRARSIALLLLGLVQLPALAHAGIVRRDRDSTQVRIVIPGDSLGERAPGRDSLLDLESPPDEDEWNGLHPRKGPGLLPRRGISPSIDYNRVDQLRLGLGLRTVTRDAFTPRLEIEVSRSFGREQWNYDVSAEQPLAKGPYLAAGGEFYRITDTFDRGLVTHAENLLSALFFRQDYFDYFGRRGARAFARIEWDRRAALLLGFRIDRLVPLATIPSTWSLFGGNRQFRANPATEAGSLHQLELEFMRNGRPPGRVSRPGLDFATALDVAGRKLGGDFDFSRAEAEYRWTFKLSPGVTVHQRTAAGARLSGGLPGAFEYHAGGVGTLRGHEYKQFHGDRYYLVNLEYAANLGQHIPSFDRSEALRGLELVLFLDSGKAWDSGSSEASPASPAWDAGVGLQTQGDGFHLYLAQDLRASDAGPKLTFRLGRSY